MRSGPILVTGSGGFVARHVIARLAETVPAGRIVPVVRYPPAPEGGFALDLADADATDDMVRRVAPASVVHLAAHSSPARASEVASAVWRSNRDGTYRLARALARHAPEATVLFASTALVYGRSLAAGPADETTPARPEGPYAGSKRAAEMVLDMVLPDTARLVVTRAFNHTGPGQDEAFVVPTLAAQLARIEAGLAPPVLRVGNLEPERDFLDVRDVADCYVRLLEAAEGLAPRTVVNVASGRPVSIRHILETLLELVRVQVSVEVDPARYRPAGVRTATARTARLEAIMPWPPARTLEATLRDVLDDKRAELGRAADSRNPA